MMQTWTRIAALLALSLVSADVVGAQEFTARHTIPAPSQPAGAAAPRAADPRLAGPVTPAALPLSPPGSASTPRGGGALGSGPAARAKTSGGLTSLLTMLGSLIVVLAIFLAATWVLRRSLPAGTQLLPREVIEVLGRTQLAGRQHAHLLRCGNKLVLVALTAGGAETITEITDPVEVDRLSGLCRAAQPQSSTDTFRQIFQQFGRDRGPRGFLGRRASQTELASAGTLLKGDSADA